MYRHFAYVPFFMVICAAIAVAQDRPGSPQDRGPGAGAGAGQQSDRMGGQQQRQSGQRTASVDQEMARDFIREAASANQFEIQLSQLVAQRGQDPQIKQFAQRMVQDHQQAQQQLQQAAQALNINVDNELMPAHQAKLQEFQRKQGQQLELAYIFDQVGMHHKDLLLYQFIAQNAQQPQVKQYASQAVPALRQHLAMAEQIAPGGAEARQAGERIGPGQQDGSQQGTGRDPTMPGQLPDETPGQGQQGSPGQRDRGQDR